jgi:hypothetical protein
MAVGTLHAVDDGSNDDRLPPKVTPSMLRNAPTMCGRRLRAEFLGEPGTNDPVNRARLREAILDGARAWHDTGAVPVPPAFLEPEEAAVLMHALGWYVQLYGDRPVESVALVVDEPTLLPRRGVRLGGWVDLCVVQPDGRRELRQLHLRGTAPPADPLDDEAARMSVLRLAQLRWIDEQAPILVSASDLLVGAQSERLVEPGEIGPLGAWLDTSLDAVRDRVVDAEPAPGRDCASCRYVPRCPSHSVRGQMTTRSGDLLPGVLSISPTSIDLWARCRRAWRNQVVLRVPRSDERDVTSHGLWLHDLLRLIHTSGSCHDERAVDAVLTDHAADPRSRDEVLRHTQRCPIGATGVAHEAEWARAHGRPPVFVATARLDAVWEHDGVLEVRDYKTGRVAEHSIGEDRRAWLQAWVAAPIAMTRGLRLRVRYEYLSAEVADDPEPWEPGDEELAMVEEELVSTVGAMRAERDWHGVADADICGWCNFRSICPDSAATTEPSWPAVVVGAG